MARKQILHHIGSKTETFVYDNGDGTYTVHQENEGGARVLKHGVAPREFTLSFDELQEHFKGSSLWDQIAVNLT